MSLAGRTILVTRPARGSAEDPLSQALRELGAKVLWLPALEIGPPDAPEPLDQALRGLASFDWVAFTSQNAVEAFERRRVALGVVWGERPRPAAVGRKTAAALVRLGRDDVFVSPEPLASVLADSVAGAVPRQARGQKVLWPRAQVAPNELSDRLRNAGVEVTSVAAYHARAGTADAAPVRAALAEQRVDAAAFASARAIEATLEALGPEAREWLQRIPRICIGPVTAQACQDLGLGRPTVAHDASLKGIVEALQQVLDSS